MAPNAKLNKIVLRIDQGTIFYRLYSPPQKIVDVGFGWKLKNPDYALQGDEKLVAMGYRHCPTHWEWVLMLRHYKGSQWLDEIQKEFSEGFGGVGEIQPTNMFPPAINIVKEPNDWTSKGGVEEQISVYLKSDEKVFQWTPSADQIMTQLRLAFGRYGWDGATGLKAEIFDRI